MARLKKDIHIILSESEALSLFHLLYAGVDSFTLEKQGLESLCDILKQLHKDVEEYPAYSAYAKISEE